MADKSNWNLFTDFRMTAVAMWSEPEACALKYWKEDSFVREVEAGRGEDGPMISRTGQTEQWWSVHSWRGTGNDGDCWYTLHKVMSDPQQ